LFDGTARFSTVDAAVEMALPVLGISAPLGKAFHCVIPGHDDKSPSASLYKDSLTGAWKYRDWHHAGKYEWLMLADVRAAQSAGRVVELGPSSALLWYRRLFWEAGVLKIADIQKVPLLHNARPTIRLVAEGFALLLAIKNIGNEEISSPYSAEFAAAWCGVTFDQARYSIRELKKMDVLRPVDVYRSPKDGVRKMYLYEIGKGKKS